MSYRITRFESTPNPNAVKCWLDRPISAGPKSFLDRGMADDDPVAAALFDDAGATTVFFNGDWLTFNKSPDADWNAARDAIRRVLADADDDDSASDANGRNDTGGNNA